jgi:hypothetical protein
VRATVGRESDVRQDLTRAIARRLCEQEVPVAREAITRNAFLYLEPREEKNVDQHAQCATCAMFTGEEHETCTIHGPNERIVAGGSCGLYVEGDPMSDEAGHEMVLVTKDESGYVERQVRCENCAVFELDGTACTLYDNLNAMEHGLFRFELDSKVDPKGCCNAQTPKGEAT